VGLNLYVVQGMRGRGSINEVIRGSLPFVFCMLVLIALLMVYPDVTLWLPRSPMGCRGQPAAAAIPCDGRRLAL
jgi:TRAP-type C4-dicarboxylate transport system permease large subunit